MCILRGETLDSFFFVHSNQQFTDEANLKFSTRCGNGVHPNAATDMHGTVSVLDDLAFCGLYTVEYYVGIAGNCTP